MVFIGQPCILMLCIFAVAVGVAVAPERHAIKISINNYYLVVSFSLLLHARKCSMNFSFAFGRTVQLECVPPPNDAKGLLDLLDQQENYIQRKLFW